MSKILSTQKRRLFVQKQEMKKMQSLSYKHQIKILSSQNNALHTIRKIARSNRLTIINIRQWPYTKKEMIHHNTFLKKSRIYVAFLSYREKNFWEFINKVNKSENFDAVARLLSVKKIYNESTGRFVLKGVYYFSCYELQSKRS
jgi:hypothetical protein